MTKSVRARYTLEFKQEAVRLVEGGQSIAAAARSLNMCGAHRGVATRCRHSSCRIRNLKAGTRRSRSG